MPRNTRKVLARKVLGRHVQQGQFRDVFATSQIFRLDCQSPPSGVLPHA